MAELIGRKGREVYDPKRWIDLGRKDVQYHGDDDPRIKYARPNYIDSTGTPVWEHETSREANTRKTEYNKRNVSRRVKEKQIDLTQISQSGNL